MDGADIGIAVAVGVALAAVVVANVFTTVRLWRSSMFERPQKIAQTAMIWLIPGAFAVVRYAMGPTSSGWPGVDSTSISDSFVEDGSSTAGHGGGEHSGGGD